MKTQIRSLLLTITMFAATVSPLRTQIVADGATSILSNVTNTFTGDVTVGTNGSFTLLVLSDIALLTNSVNGIIGRNATAKSNEVRLTSATARWRMGGNLFLGSNGPFNRLIVSNGAFLDNNTGFLGRNAGSSNNFALVTGNGSLWSNRVDLAVGILGGGNQLVVSDGGALRSALSIIGYLAGANSNAVTVTGPGAIWNIASNLQVGLDGVGNRMTVSNGGSVFGAGQTFVGTGNGVGVNTLTVTGSGSMWSNAMDFIVGYSGASNRLEVRDGGWLQNGRGALGANASADNNTALVTGASSVWSNGLDLIVGDLGSGNVLIASNGATVLSSNATIGAGTTLGNNNLALVTGNGSLWSNRNHLTVGNHSFGNRLVVSNGAIFVNGVSSSLGANAGANSNSVTVTGSGSVWSNAGGLNIGDAGSGNRLVISNGGRMESLATAIGETGASSNNEAIVTGLGSSWSDSNFFAVGYGGAGNRLTVSDGGVVRSVNGSIGFVGGTNLALVTGAGSSWSNAGTLFVGGSGKGNGLVISNAAVFSSETVIVGYDSSSLNNRVVVDGGTLRAANASGTAVLDVRRGTNVLNSGTIDVDRLVLTNETQGKFEFNGGTLITRGLALATTNPLAVFAVNRNGPTPATWDVRAGVSNYFLPAAIYVGSNSSFNQLLITNGAELTTARVTLIGANKGADSNIALISGAGSVWSNANIFIGESGSYNQLVVSNGALVVSGNAHFSSFGGSNNTALVTGTGSVWNASSLDLRAGSWVVISNGGTIFATNGIEAHGSATNNRIVVDGGTLRATNATGTAILEIRGTNVLNSGLIEADLLIMTNTFGFPGSFEFNGGTFKPRATAYDNGRVFTVGNGASVATLQLRGGTHGFTAGLLVANNGTLTGNGTVIGTMAVFSGGTLSPGDGVGTLIFSNTPSLNGTVIMEVLKIGATRSFDQIQVAGTLFYGGTLTVTSVDVTTFTAGDNFKLFNAAVYGSSFASLNLPPLNAGLGWTNKLLVDGSIEVVAVAVSQPKFGNITLSGANVILSGTNGTPGASYAVLTATNVALPSSNWTSIATNQFGAGGAFSFTNPIAPGEFQRYFRIRTP